jgi:hypothetical protein
MFLIQTIRAPPPQRANSAPPQGYAPQFGNLCLKGSLTHHKILWQRVNGFTSPTKKIVLQTLSPLKNPPLSARFELSNLGSNGKHDNHDTTKNDSIALEYQYYDIKSVYFINPGPAQCYGKLPSAEQE